MGKSIMTKNEKRKLLTLLQATEGELHKGLAAWIKQFYKPEQIHDGDQYIYADSDVMPEILLVAHMDTVFAAPPQEIYHDQEQDVIISPHGLGADDRAGIYAITALLSKGYLPRVLFTSGEEKGGIGAQIFLNDFPNTPKDLKYIIQLDRQGEDDCVFYNCDNKDFEKYVESFGFVTDWGTFTDISYLCPKWKIAGVNISVGYWREHTPSEILNLRCLVKTIDRVTKMLDDAKNVKSYEYIPAKDSYSHWMQRAFKSIADDKDAETGWEWNDSAVVQCEKCKAWFDESDTFPIKDIDGKTIYRCFDCIDGEVAWCIECGEPFLPATPDATFCPDCRKRMSYSDKRGIKL